jgi:hypothetical protein
MISNPRPVLAPVTKITSAGLIFAVLGLLSFDEKRCRDVRGSSIYGISLEFDPIGPSEVQRNLNPGASSFN